MDNGSFLGFPNVVDCHQFSPGFLRSFFPIVEEMRSSLKLPRRPMLEGKIMLTYFDQFSVRTETSFKAAMVKLGGNVIWQNGGEFSSAVGGGSIQDLMRVLCSHHPDVIVLRLNQEGSVNQAVEHSSVPVINAGDGKLGQHPTQALADISTIKDRFGNITGQKVVIIGDINTNRAVRSFAYLLGRYQGMEIHVVSPDKKPIEEGMADYLQRHDVRCCQTDSLASAIEMADVLYVTGIQMADNSPLDYESKKGAPFQVNAKVVAAMKKTAIIMHPLPRKKEIHADVDNDPRAVYFTSQIESGLSVRMALLKMILAPNT